MLGVIFNTCGLHGHDNSQHYIGAIESILKQDFKDFRVVLSDCCSRADVRNKIRDHFRSRISYSFVNEVVPVFVTFNYACQRFNKIFNNTEGYVYIDSGITFEPHGHVLEDIYEEFNQNKERVGMVAVSSDDDNSGYCHASRPEPYENGLCAIGQHMNLHVLFISEKMRKFYGKCLPDVFQGCGSEGTYPYLCSAMRTEMRIVDTRLHHARSMDGRNIGFPRGDYLALYLRDGSIQDVARCGKDVGFGFEEWVNDTYAHDPNMFDDAGLAKNNKLFLFLRNSLYLKNRELDYEKISVEYIE